MSAIRLGTGLATGSEIDQWRNDKQIAIIMQFNECPRGEVEDDVGDAGGHPTRNWGPVKVAPEEVTSKLRFEEEGSISRGKRKDGILQA